MPILTHSDLYSGNGKAKTQDLFIEYNKESTLTLAKDNKDGAVSLYKLFVALTVDDPSEVQFAEEVFGDVGFWLKLQDSPILSSLVLDWRKVASQKRKQKAFAAILKEVEDNGRSAFTAAKYLIEEPWKEIGTVAQKKKARQDIAESADEAYKASSITEDVKRLRNAGLIN